jgi:hypothetical protein
MEPTKNRADMRDLLAGAARDVRRIAIRGWLGHYAAAILRWAAVIGGSVILLPVTCGTQYHQLAIGLLASSVTLLVALTVASGYSFRRSHRNKGRDLKPGRQLGLRTNSALKWELGSVSVCVQGADYHLSVELNGPLRCCPQTDRFGVAT